MLHIADVGGPEAWTPLSVYNPADRPEWYPPTVGPALAADERHVFVPVHQYNRGGLMGPPQIHVVDVTDPRAPRRIAALPLEMGGAITDLALAGRALAVSGPDGLRLVDVSDPAAPFVRWSAASGAALSEVEALGDTVFALSVDRFYRFSLSEATADHLVASLSLSDLGYYPQPRGLVATRSGFGAIAAFITPKEGINVYDVSRPTTPTLAVALPPAGWQPTDLWLSDRELHVLSDEGGLLVLRLPALPAPAELFRRYLPYAGLQLP